MARVTLRENFNQPPLLNASIGVAANLNFELAGTNAADVGSVPYLSGGCAISTAGANNDSVVVAPHGDAGQTAWNVITINPSEAPVARFEIITGAAITTCRIECGVRGTPTAFDDGTDNDKFCLVYDSTAGTTWQLLTSNGGTDTLVDTGITVALNSSYFVSMSVDPISFIVTCTIQQGSAPGIAPINTYSVALANVAQGKVYAGIKALAGAVRTLRLQFAALSQFQSVA